MSLLALQDLFRRYREKATGVWTLGKDPGRTIFIDYGDTVFAQSSHPHDRLTYLLVERGKVTQAQMDYALANLKPGLSIGKNLIEMGFITQRDLLDVAKAQVERIIRGALAFPDLEPSFAAQDLDANVVRLPMNTAQLFLAGTLALQDREELLELLGPLNQVVVLQGRGLQDLSLPPDLAKLPPLLDGTHTLLELSRESMAEPLRLGAFALFLREMGWARLHEMPPLDRLGAGAGAGARARDAVPAPGRAPARDGALAVLHHRGGGPPHHQPGTPFPVPGRGTPAGHGARAPVSARGGPGPHPGGAARPVRGARAGLPADPLDADPAHDRRGGAAGRPGPPVPPRPSGGAPRTDRKTVRRPGWPDYGTPDPGWPDPGRQGSAQGAAGAPGPGGPWRGRLGLVHPARPARSRPGRAAGGSPGPAPRDRRGGAAASRTRPRRGGAGSRARSRRRRSSSRLPHRPWWTSPSRPG